MDEKEFSAINVIPFIDIMLVLLTIVLTTSTFIARGSIPVQLPRASADKAELLKTVTLEIDREGGLFLDARQVFLPELAAAMNPVNRSTPVLIRADREIALQVFVDVMEKVKTIGFTKVSLQTEIKK